MAKVFLCFTQGVGDFRKLMVVKQLREELADEPEFLAMFLNEARLAAKLNHPNVVQTYEVGEDKGEFFIAMDYLEGQPLNRVLHRVGRKDVPTDVHVRILSEMLAGLHYAHELTDYSGEPLHVVHRDVSPQNVFVTYDGRVKLVDFGIAKASGAANLTKEGVVKGKVNYIAPEQARAETVDRRADIYSVGVMLWEALAGRRIAKGQSELITLHRRLNNEEPSIREVAPDAPSELLDACDKAMAFEPDDRYQTAEEFRDDLDVYLDATRSRATTKTIASLMAEHFAEDRLEMRRTVEEQIAVHEKAESEDRPPILTLDVPAPSLQTPVDLDTGSNLTSKTRVSGAQDDATPLRSQRFVQERSVPSERRPSRGVAVLAAIGAGAVAAWWLSSQPEAPLTSGLPSGSPAALSAPPPTSATTSPATTATTTSARVTLNISVEPRDATVTLDGSSLSPLPFQATVERDGSLHRLIATREGYDSVERTLTFDRDLTLSLVLTKSGGSRARAPAPAPAAGPEPTPPQPTAVTPKKPPPSRPIDETDPYK